MRKLEKLDKYVVTPNVSFYGGFVYDGEDIFLCDDHDEDENGKVSVVQKIEGGKLITNIDKEYEYQDGKKVIEKSYLEVDTDKGQLLIYVEGLGFTIPEYKMCTIDTAKEIYSLLKGEPCNDTEGNEENSTSTN